jgi:hypothetical protein
MNDECGMMNGFRVSGAGFRVAVFTSTQSLTPSTLQFIVHHSAFIISKSLASPYTIQPCDQRMKGARTV